MKIYFGNNNPAYITLKVGSMIIISSGGGAKHILATLFELLKGFPELRHCRYKLKPSGSNNAY